MKKALHPVVESLGCILVGGLYAAAIYIAVVCGADFIRNDHPAPAPPTHHTCTELTVSTEDGLKVVTIPSGHWDNIVTIGSTTYICGWVK